MSKRKVEVTIYTCDGCGKEFIEDEFEPVLGFHLNFMWHHGGGGAGGEAYACSEKCVVKAIKTAAYN